MLVADDQPDVLEALRWLLTGEGYEPQFVSSTDAVMERLRAEPFDLLLMDLNYTRDTTSGREGLELIPRVRAHDPALPIVVMTGWGSIDTAVEGDAPRREELRPEAVGGRHAARDPGARDRRSARARRRDHAAARARGRAADPARAAADGGAAGRRDRARGAWQPANGVGGDCFDTLAFGNVLGVSIADIAGKGLPAALLMSNLQAAVRAFAQEAAAPSVGLRERQPAAVPQHGERPVRDVLLRAHRADAGRVVYSNAGHNPPLLVRADGSTATLSEGGMVLGVFPDNAYEQAELPVGPAIASSSTPTPTVNTFTGDNSKTMRR